MSDIELVLFDFGGVFTNSPLAAFRAVGPELGIDPDELFDHVVDSCEVGLRKPDPRIYELALSRFPGATPARTAFLDDLPSNIAGAEAVGMVGVLVEDDQSSAIRWLEDLAQRRQDGRK